MCPVGPGGSQHSRATPTSPSLAGQRNHQRHPRSVPGHLSFSTPLLDMNSTARDTVCCFILLFFLLIFIYLFVPFLFCVCVFACFCFCMCVVVFRLLLLLLCLFVWFLVCCFCGFVAFYYCCWCPPPPPPTNNNNKKPHHQSQMGGSCCFGGGGGGNLFLFYGSVRQGACCDIANSSTMTRESNYRFTNCFPISPDCCRLLVLSDVEGALLRTLRLRLKDLCGGKLMFAEINRGCGGGWGRVTVQLSNKVKFYGISFSKFLELIILCQDLNQSKLTSVRFLLSFFLFYYH